MIRGVLFDLDGTLIDSTDAIVDSFYYTLDRLGEPRPPRGAIVSSIGHLLEDQFRIMLPEYDADECARIYREHYSQVACEMTSLLPGGRDALETLADAGLRLGFATSKKRVYAEMILDHLGVLDYFAARIGPDDVQHAKPHPEAVLMAAEQLVLSSSEIFFIGDTHFDVEAGHAAGARVLCVTTGYATRDALEALDAEAVYDSLEEVTRHILGAIAPAHTPGDR
ncbi:MAG: HAD-IA family hydrolase [Candidatus Hydrogenedentes bacterium]|nr:HAD-IA family hydrolase [Candidatus Hydrogenedentota bacterium]